MREPSVRDIQKEEILEKCFKYLVDTGLEKVTTRTLSKETGMSTSSIYYWFGDIDTLILDSTKYGLHSIVSKLFDYILSKFEDVNQLIIELPDEVLKYDRDLQFIYQVATSPHYGVEMKKDSKYLVEVFDEYAKVLNSKFEHEIKDFNLYVYMFKNSITNYIVWGDVDRAKKELEFVCNIAFNNKGEVY